jgi:2-hydroxy-6-oxonona-2,4-dienedioate hydrolase
MKTSRWIALGVVSALAVAVAWIALAYRSALSAARQRVSTGSSVAQTKCGPIEYALRGEGPPLLIVHGAGGGFDQGLLLGTPLPGFQVIAMSRFGYLRTPLPPDASAEAQADAHACLLDALHVDRVAVLGVSAGAPSTLQFCLRHAERCAAMVLLVPMTWGERPANASAPAPSRTQQFVIRHTLNSDFVFWATTRLFRDTLIESILATPLTDVKAASADDRMSSMLDSIQPISRREKGLRNEGAVAQSLRRYELEKIAAPSLIASVEDDLFLTYANARYTAEHIPGAQFVGFARGGHLWVGHDAELAAAVTKFLVGTRTTGVR